MSSAEDQDRGGGAAETEQYAPPTEVERLKGVIAAMASRLATVEDLVREASNMNYVTAAAVLTPRECEAGEEVNDVLSQAFAKLCDASGHVEECLKLVKDNDIDYWRLGLPMSTEHSEQASVEMNAEQAEAQPDDAQQRAADAQRRGTQSSHPESDLQTQLKKQQELIDSTVKALSATAVDLDRVANYFYTAMQALQAEGAGAIGHILQVVDDAYCLLLDDVSHEIDTVLEEMDPAGSDERLRLRKLGLS